MYLPIDPQPTNAQGWLAAASAVQARGGEAHNVIIDIADPLAESDKDVAIIRAVDAFFRAIMQTARAASPTQSSHRQRSSGTDRLIFIACTANGSCRESRR